MGKFAMGQSVPRTEDPRLLTGRGRYIDDVSLMNQCHAFVLRSPHAHAHIRAIDGSAARNLPGVIAIFTGPDWAANGLGHYVPPLQRERRDGSPMYVPARPALALDRVMLVGDPVAFILAETADQAKDAAEVIAVDYEPLPILVATDAAKHPDSPSLWDACPDNESFFFTAGNREAVTAAFARAHHVTNLRLVINRVTAATMEPRACVGAYDSVDERYTIHSGQQRPHGLRRDLAKQVFGIPEAHIRVVAGDVGGSFGMKGAHYPEHALSLWASRKVGRPVKWTSTRAEGMLSDDQDRDLVSDAALALDADGRFLALELSNIANLGAYLMPGGIISPTMHLGGLAGVYTTPAIYAEVSCVFSNTGSIGPYRGAGRPEASYIVERLIDNAAREMGIERAEIRRRNTIAADAMPYQTGLVFTYDCGEFEKNMDMAMHLADYGEFEARREDTQARGKLRGIGMANVTEQTSNNLGETVEIRIDSTGVATVIPGSSSHGQGHDTMYKILISDRLGLDEDNIRVTQVDTDVAPNGYGTYASRTATLGGGAAVIAADRIIEKATSIAAHLVEAAASDMEFDDGAFRVAGTDRVVTMEQVAHAAYIPSMLADDIETGLHENATFAPEVPNFPNGCHICEVEIDPDTGTTEMLRYAVVDDVGTVINPLTLAGQMHGGIAQGVGQAFTEHIVFDPESGQLVTGTFLDYGMPRADDMCSFHVEENPVPTATNPLGVKGAGEAGNVGALAAIMNAVVDALAPLGVSHIDMPATPEKVWRAIRDSD